MMKGTTKLLFSAAILFILSASSCDKPGCKKNSSAKKVKSSCKSKSKKKNKSESKKKESKKNMNIFEEEDVNVASANHNDLINEFSTSQSLEERAAEAEKEIQRLIALLEDENAKLKQDSANFEDTTFQTVFFDSESKNINGDQSDAMEENIQKAVSAAKAGHKVVIRGHSDVFENSSNEVENIALARERAESIKEKMLESGVPEDKIELAAMGTSQPIVWSASGDLDADDYRNLYNRRAEILTL